jgi:hypothetical protein
VDPELTHEQSATPQEGAAMQKGYFIDAAAADAFARSFAEFLGAANKEALAPFLSPSNTHHLRHGSEWTHPNTPSIGPGEMQQHSATMEARFEDLSNNNLAALHRTIQQVVAAFHEQFVKMVFSTVSDACEQVGNTVDARSFDNMEDPFLEMLRKMQFFLGPDGKLQMPDIHAGPQVVAKLRELDRNASPEFKAKLAELLAQKEQEAREREQVRRARFVRYGEGP